MKMNDLNSFKNRGQRSTVLTWGGNDKLKFGTLIRFSSMRLCHFPRAAHRAAEEAGGTGEEEEEEEEEGEGRNLHVNSVALTSTSRTPTLASMPNSACTQNGNSNNSHIYSKTISTQQRQQQNQFISARSTYLVS